MTNTPTPVLGAEEMRHRTVDALLADWKSTEAAVEAPFVPGGSAGRP